MVTNNYSTHLRSVPTAHSTSFNSKSTNGWNTAARVHQCFNHSGRDPLSQNFRKFRYKIKWNGIFRKLCFENSGQPLEVVLFSENLEIPEIFCSIWHSIIKSSKIDLPDSQRRNSWLAILHKKRRFLLFGCNEWSPMWISYRHATSLDNSLAENMREVCTFPVSSENDF